jgi:hypothetical protein
MEIIFDARRQVLDLLDAGFSSIEVGAQLFRHAMQHHPDDETIRMLLDSGKMIVEEDGHLSLSDDVTLGELRRLSDLVAKEKLDES